MVTINSLLKEGFSTGKVRVPLPPDGSGKLCLINLTAPPQHPDAPWLTDDPSLLFLRQDVHMGTFLTWLDDDSPDVVTIKPHGGTFVDLVAWCVTLEAKEAVAWTGWPICQYAGDGLCRGKYRGNVASPCYDLGCGSAWPIPEMLLTDSALVLAFWAGHKAARPIDPPMDWELIGAETIGNITSIVAMKEFVPGNLGEHHATPRILSEWEHAVVQLVAVV